MIRNAFRPNSTTAFRQNSIDICLWMHSAPERNSWLQVVLSFPGLEEEKMECFTPYKEVHRHMLHRHMLSRELLNKLIENVREY